jgi:hypothetical protein
MFDAPMDPDDGTPGKRPSVPLCAPAEGQDVTDVGNARLSYGDRPSYRQLPVYPR